MRWTFVFGAATAAALFLGVVYFASRTVRPNVVETTSTAPTHDTARVVVTRSKQRVDKAPRVADPVANKQSQDDIAEMDNAMLQVDARTLPLLTEKLSASDRQVRQAAVSNIVTLADRDAIPALTEAADRAVDSEEKTNILKAIEFLQLPTYNELVENGQMQPLGKTAGNVHQTGLERYSPRVAPKPQANDSAK